MDINHMIMEMGSKDTTQAFEALKELERISEDSDEVYPYIDRFVEMIRDEKYVIRVRGFRLFCSQAKWDSENKINKYIKDALNILEDEKPTAVRQGLAALAALVPYKKELNDLVKARVLAIDPYGYKETMHSLILKDAAALVEQIDGLREREG